VIWYDDLSDVFWGLDQLAHEVMDEGQRFKLQNNSKLKTSLGSKKANFGLGRSLAGVYDRPGEDRSRITNIPLSFLQPEFYSHYQHRTVGKGWISDGEKFEVSL